MEWVATIGFHFFYYPLFPLAEQPDRSLVYDNSLTKLKEVSYAYGILDI
jgi:hypothetical protein